jgi:predicted transcriptional regulator
MIVADASVGQYRRSVITPADPVVADRGRARALREQFLDQLLDPDESTPLWIDLNQIQVLTIGAADELIVQWLARLHARRFRLPVVFATYSDEIRDTIDTALRAAGQAAYRVKSAPFNEPVELVGNVSVSQRETIEVIRQLGPTTVAAIAQALGLAKTAAANRLTDLSAHGLVVVASGPGGARTYADPWRSSAAYRASGNGKTSSPAKHGSGNGRAELA